jgi:hypothetical protein
MDRFHGSTPVRVRLRVFWVFLGIFWVFTVSYLLSVLSTNFRVDDGLQLSRQKRSFLMDQVKIQAESIARPFGLMIKLGCIGPDISGN